MTKKVSIMMMTFNSKDDVENTLNSIEMQDYPNIEVVIADGGSTDGTLDVIAKHKASSKCDIQCVSEKDHGLYDALNKDVKRATGDYLLVGNDQYIDPSAITKLVTSLEENHADGSHCDLIYATDEKVVRYWHMGNGRIQNGWLPGHPALLLKKEVYDKYGLYKTDYRIAADYEFMCRMLKDGTTKLSYVPEILIRMYYGGTSTGSSASYWASIKEGVKALQSNGYHNAWGITFLRTCRVLKQFKALKEANAVWQSRNK